MTLKSLRLAAVMASMSATFAGAAPLTQTTAVHFKPDAASPAFAVLKSGTEPTVAADATAPAGWTAVTIAGPHEVYAANKDINKALEVKAGAAYRTDAKADAPILAIAEAEDPAVITGLRGKWTQLKLSKPVVGYIQVAQAPAAPIASPAVATSSGVTDTASGQPSAPTAVVPGKAVDSGDGGSSALPRLFQGKMASTRNPLRPRRPYDFQLNDDAGARYAYLDVSKLLATEQIDKYLERTVIVYGTAQTVPNTKDVVIRVESLQLR